MASARREFEDRSERAIAEARDAHEKKLTDLERQHAELLARTRSDHEKELAERERQHSERTAEELARHGVELAEAGEEKANLLHTLAEICQMRGKGDEAVALIRQAIEEQPDSEYYKEQLVRFQIENAPIL